MTYNDSRPGDIDASTLGSGGLINETYGGGRIVI